MNTNKSNKKKSRNQRIVGIRDRNWKVFYENKYKPSSVTCRILTQQTTGIRVPRYISPFPDTHRVQMRYTQQVNLTGSAVIEQVFRANSIYDCDRSGVGYQPLYYDQLAAVYLNYLVLGARININYINSASNLVHCSVFPSANYTYAGSLSDRQEQPNSSYAVLGTTGGSASEVFLATYGDTADIMGKIDPEDDPNLGADTSSNPNSSWYFISYIQTMDVSTATVYAFYTVDFDVLWTKRRAIYDL